MIAAHKDRGRPRNAPLIGLLVVTAVLASGCGARAGPGVEPTTTVEAVDGSRAGEKLPGFPLYSLVDGNDVTLDRINLVIAGWGWDDFDRFVETARYSLSWEGAPYLVDDEGWLFEGPSEDAWAANLGVFAIEPWRSDRNLFNVWYTDVEPDTPVAWLNEGEPPFRLPDQTIAVLAMDTDRYNPALGSVAGQDLVFYGPDPPVRPDDDRPFANFVVVLTSDAPSAGLAEFPHELGHAMFGFPDEYVGQIHGFDGRFDLSSWPSCAENMEEARNWWGDLEGDVDPMVDIWAAEMQSIGWYIGEPEDLASLVEVGYVDGGCYGVPGSVRATEDSLMNSSIPVLGSVNRRWAERVLILWNGDERP